jgi:NitT/TauT family transport system substrate-binding protein
MRLRALLATLVAATGLGSAALAQDPPDLRISGNTSTLELTPALMAASLYPGKVAVANGGIPDLFKPDGPDLATNAETQLLRASVDHPDLRIILTVSEGFYRIVGRRSAGIAHLADLRGKRIATVPNTSSAYSLNRMLASVGLSEADVTIVPVLPLSKMAAALKSGQVDAVTIWEPEIQNAKDAIGADAIEFQDRRVYRELFNLNTTEARLRDPATRRRIVAFVRVLVSASASLRRTPKAGWPLAARSTGYDPALIARVWRHEGFPAALPRDMLDVLVDEEAWVAKERARQPRSREQLARLIDSSVLSEALAQSPVP